MTSNNGHNKNCPLQEWAGSKGPLIFSCVEIPREFDETEPEVCVSVPDSLVFLPVLVSKWRQPRQTSQVQWTYIQIVYKVVYKVVYKFVHRIIF